jgi:deoxycytidylate deaminase/preprotein translocase subunit Sss1
MVTRTPDIFRHAELVFALVAPVGIDYEQVSENLKSQLSEFGYTASSIKLSSKIAPLCRLFGIDAPLEVTDEARRVESHMKAANLLYQKFNKSVDKSERNALLALSGASDVAAERRRQSSSKEESSALLNRAHILSTLKRPEEIEYLRRIYGIGLHVIGIFGTEDERIRYLTRQRHLSAPDAKRLVNIDENDREEGGQRTGDAYHLADVFINGGGGSDRWKQDLGRYLDLIFSHPYKTPTRDEQSMFMAYAASLRSAQFGRQVGAAISSNEGELLAIGCNEVPKRGGGQYWYGDDPDERDHQKGFDSNDEEKNRILQQILECLPESMRSDELKDKLRETSLFAIIEYGRATHAEMEALLSCARRGISTERTILYTTTFPCHNCTRHIIDAGVKKVVYIEPYPKSKAMLLHDDAVGLNEEGRETMEPSKVPFVSFVGISPRKYVEIFTVKPMYGRNVDRKLKSSGNAISWQRSKSLPRLVMLPISYIEREALAVSTLDESVKRQGLATDTTSRRRKE